MWVEECVLKEEWMKEVLKCNLFEMKIYGLGTKDMPLDFYCRCIYWYISLIPHKKKRIRKSNKKSFDNYVHNILVITKIDNI